MSNILKETLSKQPLICAEGYLFEMERRGYLTSGEFVPEVALESVSYTHLTLPTKRIV